MVGSITLNKYEQNCSNFFDLGFCRLVKIYTNGFTNEPECDKL